jgi:hypothetical protein
MTSKLIGIGTVTITSGGSTVTAPVPQLLSNLKLLHRILEDVILDWHRAVAPYEARMTESPNPDSIMAVAFLELQPALLKCLFSYVMFFVAADRAYNAYASLNQANRSARVRHGKPPRWWKKHGLSATCRLRIFLPRRLRTSTLGQG